MDELHREKQGSLRLNRRDVRRLGRRGSGPSGSRRPRCIRELIAGLTILAGAACGAPAERAATFARLVETVHASIRTLRGLPIPVVAAVHGAVAGFGVSLMLACDLAIAADDALFTLAYGQIGTSPDGGATFHLPRAVGQKRAMELAMLGERIDAATAERFGLVNRVVPVAELDSEVARVAGRLADGPTAALARTKALLNEAYDRDLAAHLDAERDGFVASAATADFAEGIAAFVAKRPPRFEGR